MKAPVVRIEGLSKRYRLGRRIGAVPVPKVFGLAPPDMSAKARQESNIDDDDDENFDEQEDDETSSGPAREHWALRNVSLDVAPGAAIGLIGPNGAGKSTLLKVLCRVTPPTEGRVLLRGRVAPLLEIASGFMHPELTGQGNVRLLAQLFGVPGAVVHRRMGEVFAFAQLEGLEDTHLKRYSSGMTKRLAFSAAINLEPDILLSDGILGVGDAAFRERCIDHVERQHERGLALLFASHELETVRRLCREVVWLEEGRIHRHGPVEAVLAEYEAAYGGEDAKGHGGTQLRRTKPSMAKSDLGSLLEARIITRGGEPIHALGRDDEAVIEWEVELAREAELVLSLVLFGEDGLVRRLKSPPEWKNRHAPGSVTVRVELLPGALPGGRYSARAAAWLAVDGRRTKCLLDGPFAFDVDELPEDVEEAPERDAWVTGARNWQLERTDSRNRQGAPR